MRSLFEDLGTSDAEVVLLDLEAGWPDIAQATVFGTPYGPLVKALGGTAMTELLDDFGERLGATGGGVSVTTTAHVLTARA